MVSATLKVTGYQEDSGKMKIMDDQENEGFRMNTFFRTLFRSLFILCLIIRSNAGWGFTQPTNECPDKFTGVVTKVLHPGPTQSAPDWIEIHFEVTEKMSGNPNSDPVIKILKYGPFKFLVGEEYIVSLRNGFLCMAELSK